MRPGAWCRIADTQLRRSRQRNAALRRDASPRLPAAWPRRSYTGEPRQRSLCVTLHTLGRRGTWPVDVLASARSRGGAETTRLGHLGKRIHTPLNTIKPQGLYQGTCFPVCRLPACSATWIPTPLRWLIEKNVRTVGGSLPKTPCCPGIRSLMLEKNLYTIHLSSIFLTHTCATCAATTTPPRGRSDEPSPREHRTIDGRLMYHAAWAGMHRARDFAHLCFLGNGRGPRSCLVQQCGCPRYSPSPRTRGCEASRLVRDGKCLGSVSYRSARAR